MALLRPRACACGSACAWTAPTSLLCLARLLGRSPDATHCARCCVCCACSDAPADARHGAPLLCLAQPLSRVSTGR